MGTETKRPGCGAKRTTCYVLFMLVLGFPKTVQPHPLFPLQMFARLCLDVIQILRPLYVTNTNE